MEFEFKQVKPFTPEQSAAFRAANPEQAAAIDASMRKLRADLVAEFGEEAAERLMPSALQR